MTTQAHHGVGAETAAGAAMLRWFFDEVMPLWDAALIGDAGPEALADLCAAPMVVSTCDAVVQAPDRAAVARLLETHILSLRLADNDHVLLPDCRVTAYSPVAGSIDVIWSHRHADGEEFLRLAVHYDLARIDDAWRITTTHVAPTAESNLTRLWAPMPAHEI